MVSAGDLVELGPGCGAVYTDTDRFQIFHVQHPPALPGQARITGRWWPPTDNREVTLTVRLDGLRLIAPTEPA